MSCHVFWLFLPYWDWSFQCQGRGVTELELSCMMKEGACGEQLRLIKVACRGNFAS